MCEKIVDTLGAVRLELVSRMAALSHGAARWRVSPDVAAQLREEKIPGVAVRASNGIATVSATLDLVPILERRLGSALLAVPKVAPQIALPATTKSLQPWQADAALKLAAGEKSVLWFATGLGKTGAALVAARATGAKRVLVVTRSMGRLSWPRDFQWTCPTGGGMVLLIGEQSLGAQIAAKRVEKQLRKLGYAACFAIASDLAGALRVKTQATFLVVGWETLASQVDTLLAWSPELVIFDEHHMGKGRLANRTEAAHRLALQVRRVWSLTATPVRDGIRDLWAQLVAVAPRSWGTSWSFVHRYCDAKPGRWGGLDSSGSSNLEELRERCRYFAEIKTRDEIRHLLPDKTRDVIRLSSDSVKKVLTKKPRWADRRGIEAAIGLAADAKFDYLVDRCVECLIGNEKLILVGNRRAWVPKIAAEISDSLPRTTHAWIRATSGADTVLDRQALAAEFMAQPSKALLVATIDSISESIDLHDADRLIVAALPYTPGSLVQLEGRVSRLGGSRAVTIDYIVAEGTIDEAIEELLLRKLDASEAAGTDTESGAGMGAAATLRGNEDEIIARLVERLRVGEEAA